MFDLASFPSPLREQIGIAQEIFKEREEIFKEREEQDAKWGPQRNLNNALWSLILGEEVGEVCNAILENKARELSYDPGGEQDIREELIQVAAVAMAWVECLDHNTPEAV